MNIDDMSLVLTIFDKNYTKKGGQKNIQLKKMR